MNPFVNPKKRSISLPGGCKDLIDVLQRSERVDGETIRRFVHLIFLQAQEDRATELVIGASSVNGDAPIKYKVAEIWYDMTFPSHIRSAVVTELTRMAGLPAGQFPLEGVLDVSFGSIRLKWVVKATSADGEFTLTRADN